MKTRDDGGPSRLTPEQEALLTAVHGCRKTHYKRALVHQMIDAGYVEPWFPGVDTPSYAAADLILTGRGGEVVFDLFAGVRVSAQDHFDWSTDGISVFHGHDKVCQLTRSSADGNLIVEAVNVFLAARSTP